MALGGKTYGQVESSPAVTFNQKQRNHLLITECNQLAADVSISSRFVIFKTLIDAVGIKSNSFEDVKNMWKRKD